MIDNQTILSIGTAIIAPIIAYLKIRDERNATADKRDTQMALLTKRIDDAEDKIDTLEELKNSIERINVTLAKIETILEIYIKKQSGV